MNARWKDLARALPAVLVGCGAAPRPEPPSGAVDPGSAGLATAGDRGTAQRAHTGDPSALLGGVGGPAGHAGAPGAGRIAPGSDARAAEATGKIMMTREHCEALGRKFAELTAEQQAPGGGSLDRSGLTREGDKLGRDFADRCARDMGGQEVEAREYQCMLRARAPDELLGCRK